MRQYLFFAALVLGLVIDSCYCKLAFVDLWEKEHFELKANATDTKKYLGHIDYWVLHSFGREGCDGYIERLFVEKSARQHGLGSSLFSQAINYIDAYEPSKTYLLAYPLRSVDLGYKSTGRAFKDNMKKLLAFYARLGAVPCQEAIGKGQSPFCVFDHEDAELVGLRIADALAVHAAYTTHLCQKETLRAAKIVQVISAKRSKNIGELRYEFTGKSSKKKVTGLTLSDKDVSQVILNEVAQLLIKEMNMPRASVKKMLAKALESDESLPTLYEFSDGRFGGDELAIAGW